nr:hypothetical protein [Candidatus Microthrix sp.]
MAHLSPQANAAHAPKPYPSVPTRADYPAIERAILDRWDDEATFEASVEARSPDDEFVFTTVRRSPTACLTTATC